MRFKPGQQVVCSHDPKVWSPNEFSHPKVGEIVTVHAFSCERMGKTYIDISEYLASPNGQLQEFFEGHFEPLMEITELTEILESVPESV